MKLFLLVLVAGLLVFAYLEVRWPFSGAAVANCLLTEKGATTRTLRLISSQRVQATK
jgi:xanthosine utilization system XapX-like protein